MPVQRVAGSCVLVDRDFTTVAALAELVGAGHFAQLETPEAVAEAVRRQVRLLSGTQ